MDIFVKGKFCDSEMKILKFTSGHEVFGINCSVVSNSIGESNCNGDVGHYDSLLAIAERTHPLQ